MMEIRTCASGVDLVIDYLEGQLAPAAAAAIERHVGGCERCQAFLASYQATARIVREATDVRLSGPLEAALLARLRERR